VSSNRTDDKEEVDTYGGKMKKQTEFLCGESEGMKPFGTPRCGWERNIKEIF
jgi:hypothetical protein